jgi:protein TonB
MALTNKSSDLDEIVFEGKNKEYGAYYLRKAYNRFLTRSLMVAIIALILGVGIPFLIFTQTATANEDKTVSTEMLAPPPTNKNEPPPPPPPPPPKALEQQMKFTAPVVVTDTTQETGLQTQDDLNNSTVNTAPVDDGNITVDDKVEDKVIETVEAPPVFTIVEEMPAFPGGEEARVKFLQDNMQYPQMAKESGIQGTVYVTFVVDENGKVIDTKVLRGIGGGCDEEAVRVVKIMPKWTPGKQTGKAVRVQFNMPIRFTLN